MTRSEEDWTKLWRLHVVGLGLTGLVDDAKPGPLGRATRALEVPALVDALLHRMYASFTVPEPTKPIGNGASPVKATNPTQGVR